MTATFVVKQAFKDIMPMLSDEEKRMLEDSLKTEGCREPLAIWRGILIDGHNRFEICERLAIPFETREVDLPDEEAVIDWIERNQLGRRNLTPDQFRFYIGSIYNRQKKRVGERGPQKSGQNDHSFPSVQKTAERLAVDQGVSPRTVRRAGKLAEELEKQPEAKQALMKGGSIAEVKKQVNQRAHEAHRLDTGDEETKTQEPRETTPEISETSARPKIDKARLASVGIERAIDAINILRSIPDKDPSRKDGLNKVRNWCDLNK